MGAVHQCESESGWRRWRYRLRLINRSKTTKMTSFFSSFYVLAMQYNSGEQLVTLLESISLDLPHDVFLTTILQHRCYIVGSQSKPLSSSSSVGVGPLPVPPSPQVVQQPITRITPSCWLDRWIAVFANVCLSFAKSVKWTELSIHFNPSCKYLSCVFETSALRSSLQVPTLIWVWLVFWRGSSQFCRLQTILQVGYF